jgi:hypothetical protein
MSESANMKLILWIVDKPIGGKVEFNLVQGCKSNDYVNANTFMA